MDGGIHRDVELIASAPTHIADVFARAGLEDDFVSGTLGVTVKLGFPGDPDNGWEVEAQLYDGKCPFWTRRSARRSGRR
uniref:Uncharacterized protein n=1 Tax=Phenylobacterium glaciei TaxID=2803784 RepID=A0A974P4U3_9CAUL|nr:hypothetical protein JKL49_09090 [Phenylobacterium glaciei]